MRCIALFRSRGFRKRRIVLFGFLVTTVELTHGVIHCALVQGYLLVVVVGSEAPCNWTGTCPWGEGLYWGNFRVGFYVIWGTWEYPKPVNTSWHSFRRYSFVNGKGAVCHVHHTISSTEWQVCCYSQQQQPFLALGDSNFVLTYCLLQQGDQHQQFLPVLTLNMDVGTLDVHLAWSQVWDFSPTICCQLPSGLLWIVNFRAKLVIQGFGYDVGFCTRAYLKQRTCLFSFGSVPGKPLKGPSPLKRQRGHC